MRGRALREALRSGRRVYGTAMEGLGTPRWPRAFAGLGLDFVFLDSEHNPVDRAMLAWACQAYAAYGVAPLLRIPEPSPWHGSMALDLGAHGVIVPYVETVAQVKAMIGAVKYRPLKGEALRRALAEGVFPSAETEPYLDNFNAEAVLTIMIESPAGVAALPDMLALGGVDAVLMGPHDLSVSHGVPEQYDHPLFLEAMQRVVRTCRAYDVGVGLHYISGSLERAIEWAEWGCNLICQRADTLYIARGIQDEIGALRRALDGEQDAASPDEIGAAGHGT
ncbi:MAG: aldolase [Anaerolineae bacterium]|nr:aldolase [Anaerolineae bacterium]